MKQQIWLAIGLTAAFLTGLMLGAQHPPSAMDEPAAAVFAAVETAEENLFSISADEPSADGFAIEVIGRETPAPPKRVLIYHTHTYEAFEQVPGNAYKETERWRTADSAHNMVRVGQELAALLRALGMEVVHDTTAFEPPNLGGAYARSLDMLTARQNAGEQYDLYIDLHRDAYIASQTGRNTVSVGGVDAARLMMLVGKGEGAIGQGYAEKPDWESNLALAQEITRALNDQAQGLCRDVRIKSGRFNQHISNACILVEAGNNKNTLAEVLAAMPYLADAIQQALEE